MSLDRSVTYVPGLYPPAVLRALKLTSDRRKLASLAFCLTRSQLSSGVEAVGKVFVGQPRVVHHTRLRRAASSAVACPLSRSYRVGVPRRAACVPVRPSCVTPHSRDGLVSRYSGRGRTAATGRSLWRAHAT